MNDEGRKLERRMRDVKEEEDEFYCDTCESLMLANSVKQITRVIAPAICFYVARRKLQRGGS